MRVRECDAKVRKDAISYPSISPRAGGAAQEAHFLAEDVDEDVPATP